MVVPLHKVWVGFSASVAVVYIYYSGLLVVVPLHRVWVGFSASVAVVYIYYSGLLVVVHCAASIGSGLGSQPP